MSDPPNMRTYHGSLEFIELGFRACWRNAQDLVSESQKLIESDLHAPALSLSVLALEELGKLFAIDGLLFARQNDTKVKTFIKSGRDHQRKLEILELLPLLLLNLSLTDSRYGKEERFNAALAISLQDLKEAGNVVMAELQKRAFVGLDDWKQKGFYVSATERAFVAPRDAVKLSVAKAVHRRAWRATTTLNFLLKDGNLERYIDQARSLRAKTTEEAHRELERLGAELAQELFDAKLQSS